MSARTRTQPGAALSHTEHQVLLGMAQGLTNPAIAGGLGVGEDTVKAAGVRVFAKLGARSRTHAVAIGCHGGLIPAPDDTGALPTPRAARVDRRAETDVRLPQDLAAELLYVIGFFAAGRTSTTVRERAQRLHDRLEQATRKRTIPPPRTRDSRP